MHDNTPTVPAPNAPGSERARTLGLIAAREGRWPVALVYLRDAITAGIYDRQALDAFGEAAARNRMPEVMVPVQERYRDPALAVHMARASLLLGDYDGVCSWLRQARPSPLASAIAAVCDMATRPGSAAQQRLLDVAYTYPDLAFIPFWETLASLAHNQGWGDVGNRAYEARVRLDAANFDAHFDYGMWLLRNGHYAAGWREFDYRMLGMGGTGTAPYLRGIPGVPRWRGEPLAGKRMLFMLEHGLGDQVLSLRWVGVMQSHGADVEVAVEAPMRALVALNCPALTLHDINQVELAAYWRGHHRQPDYWTPAFAVPAHGVPEPVATAGYLRAAPGQIAECRARLAGVNTRGLPVVGLTWHGKMEDDFMRSRAFTPEALIAHAALTEPALFVVLQKDASSQDMQCLNRLAEAAGGAVFDVSRELSDLAVTAAWIRACDEVVSCDTCVAHLAGALGHPGRVMLRNRSVWQWRSHGIGGSAWYDSLQVVPCASIESTGAGK